MRNGQRSSYKRIFQEGFVIYVTLAIIINKHGIIHTFYPRPVLACGFQIELQSQHLPHFEFVHAITHHQLKLQFPNVAQKCILALFRSLPILGLIEIDLKFSA